MPEFDADRPDVVRRAFAAGVRRHPLPGRSDPAREPSGDRRAGRRIPDRPGRGRGPRPSGQGFRPGHLDRLGELGRERVHPGRRGDRPRLPLRLLAAAAQREALRAQLALAPGAGLPVILHSRLSGADIVAAVDGERFGRGGILHCFTEDWATARAMLDRGFHISFSGILTFPKAGDLREVAAKVPLDRLLVETDSPYLAPVPYRGSGRRNEPAFVVETARVLAGLRGLPLDSLAEATTRNFAGSLPV